MNDCPDGRMNKDKMKEMFNAVAPSVSLTYFFNGTKAFDWDVPYLATNFAAIF
jgi:hypothetical protein